MEIFFLLRPLFFAFLKKLDIESDWYGVAKVMKYRKNTETGEHGSNYQNVLCWMRYRIPSGEAE